MKRAPVVLASTIAGMALVFGYHPQEQASPLIPARSGSSSASTRTLVGDTVEIGERGRRYGQIAVSATVDATGTLTGAEVASLDTYDGRSQEIASYSLPELLRESVDAGSARVSGVSGATYTSAAYETSLQSALDQLSV